MSKTCDEDETAPGFLFYDYETFGIDPARDRIAQFAAVRTDRTLTPDSEPTILYCRPAADTLPHPDACLLTGITPQVAQQQGVCEWEFAARVFNCMSQPQTCTLGYNSFRFDDEFSRYLFYRNALDPYAREYKNGNSRYDLIDLVRLCYALRPQGINWPSHDDGRPSFRLEDLTQANNIDHGQAHDAMADVYATIAIARLIQQQQPRLWDWALGLRDRYRVQDLLNNGEPLLHASARFPASRGGVAMVLPLGQHPRIRNQHIVFDLAHSPHALCTLPPDDLSDLLYTPAADLPEGMERIPVKTIKTNRAPVLAPLATLQGVDTQRISLDVEQCLRHAQQLRSCPDLSQRLYALFATNPWPASDDPEAALYDGFIDGDDRRQLARLRDRSPDQWPPLEQQFNDARLPELMFRARARNFPQTLNDDETRRWEQFCYQRLCNPRGGATITVADYRRRLNELREHTKPDADGVSTTILDALEAWLWELRVNYLEQEYGRAE